MEMKEEMEWLFRVLVWWKREREGVYYTCLIVQSTNTAGSGSSSSRQACKQTKRLQCSLGAEVKEARMGWKEGEKKEGGVGQKKFT
jgi:hypothetical protein